MDDVLRKRRENLFQFLKTKKNWILYLVLVFIAWFSYTIRTSNLGNLVDSTTGKYIPTALDPFVFLRYAKEVLATGSLAAVDLMRYYPNGYPQVGEFSLLTHFIVGLYKFLHFFNPDITLEYVHVIYPPLAFSFTLILFFFLVRKLFDYRIALLATAYLTFIPILLYRTTGGFSDKESFALLLFTLALYSYVSAWISKTRLKSILLGLFAGLFTGLMGLTWGGVGFLFLLFGLFGLIEIFLTKFTNNDFYTYASWAFVSFFIMSSFSGRYSFSSLLSSPSTAIVPFVFLIGLIDYVLRNYDPLALKDKLHGKLPSGVFSFIVASLLSFLLVVITRGFSFVVSLVQGQFESLTHPLGQGRWGITVAESHQPYLVDVLGQLGNFYFFLFLTGSVLLFYTMVKTLQKHKFKLTFFYTAFILAFLFSRYSQDSTLNGANNLSIFMYLGSLSLFVLGLFAFYIYAYKKDKETYQRILNINKVYTLVFIWFIIKIVAARTMVRLIMLLAFITVILVAYLFVTTFDYASQQKNYFYKYFIILVLLGLIFYPSVNGTLTSYYKSTTATAKSIGPSYNYQWQQAMAWVRENTLQDAVFVHWWDYGYWVQTGGERATVSDGGNVGGSGINYYTARNILTSPSVTDALAFMKAKGATHFLTLADDIGKYPAYSSIGSDLENDRYSWINAYHLDPSRTEERRNQTVFVYTGGTVLDEDIIYDDQLLPERNAGIAGFLVPVSSPKSGNPNALTLSRPTAIVVYNNQQYSLPLNCIVFNGQRATFGKDGLDGCLLIVPKIQGNQMDPKGAAFYLSRKVKDSLFARLYLYEEKLENFELVYSDEDQVPLAVLDWRIIGPLKIWAITYPPNLEVDEALKSRDLPDPRLYYAVT